MRKAAHQGVHIWLARWDENAKIQVLDVHTQHLVKTCQPKEAFGGPDRELFKLILI